MVVVNVRWKKIQYVISELVNVSVRRMSMVSAVIVARMDSLIYKILFLVVNVSDACGDGDDGGYCYGDGDDGECDG